MHLGSAHEAHLLSVWVSQDPAYPQACPPVVVLLEDARLDDVDLLQALVLLDCARETPTAERESSRPFSGSPCSMPTCPPVVVLLEDARLDDLDLLQVPVLLDCAREVHQRVAAHGALVDLQAVELTEVLHAALQDPAVGPRRRARHLQRIV